MLTTEQARQAWGPPCTGPFSKFALYGTGVVSVRPAIIEAVRALNTCLAIYDYRTRAEATGAYNCRRITNGKGYSLHAYGIAIDINWDRNPYGSKLITDFPPGMVDAIKAVRTRNGKQIWRWGGDYSGNKDAMHFEVVCTPADLETGIKSSTVEGTPESQEDDMPLTPEDKNFLTNIQGALHHDIVVAQGLIGDLQKLLTDSSSGILVQDHEALSQNLSALKADVDAIKKKIGA